MYPKNRWFELINSVLRRRVRQQKELEALSQRMRDLEQDNALCKL